MKDNKLSKTYFFLYAFLFLGTTLSFVNAFYIYSNMDDEKKINNEINFKNEVLQKQINGNSEKILRLNREVHNNEYYASLKILENALINTEDIYFFDMLYNDQVILSKEIYGGGSEYILVDINTKVITRNYIIQ